MCKYIKSGDNPKVGEVTNIGEYRSDANEVEICNNQTKQNNDFIWKNCKLKTCKGRKIPSTESLVEGMRVQCSSANAGVRIAAWAAGSKCILSSELRGEKQCVAPDASPLEVPLPSGSGRQQAELYGVCSNVLICDALQEKLLERKELRGVKRWLLLWVVMGSFGWSTCQKLFTFR